MDGLRQLTRDQDRPPTLILAGDVLDLALSPDEVSATVFGGFAHLAFGGGQPVFDPVVHYLPGNHDHHLWETARENQYVAYVCAQPPGAELSAPWHTTKLELAAERPAASSALLTGLIRRQARLRRGRGPGVLPEPGPADPRRPPLPGGQPRALHRVHLHADVAAQGHPLPRPAPGTGPDIDALEEENFAWIDFLWSTLGRSGQVGTDMGLIYADLTSPADLDALVVQPDRGDARPRARARRGCTRPSAGR